MGDTGGPGKTPSILIIVQTTLRLDVVIRSTSQKSIIVIELTVPWEERCEEAHQRKSAKYEELVEMCVNNGVGKLTCFQ
jgi:hypothetical protein